jgi:hypothetical protein
MSGRSAGGANRFTVSASIDRVQLMRLNNAIQRSSKEAQKALKSQLRKVGQEFKTEVSKEISSKLRKRTGNLKRGTRVNTDIRNNQISVEVVNKTMARSRRWPRGYRYGKRLEFDPRFGGRFAYWYPTWERLGPKVKESFDKVLDAAYKAFVKG